VLILLLALQQLPTQDFPPIDHPGVVPDFSAAVATACSSRADTDRVALLKREDVEEQRVREGGTADAWFQLGCVRAQLDVAGALSREGLLMVAGNSWAHGAERAMLQVLSRRPGDERASEVLGLLVLEDQYADKQTAALAAIVKAVDLGKPLPATLRACGELALRMHDDSTARRCATRGLARGQDSTWHLLRLARLSFRAADTASGMQQFLAAAEAAHDSAARLEVDWHLQWFLTPDEEKAWATLPDTAYGHWVRDRLISRDVRDGQPFGARLATHFSRLEYALTNFPLHLAAVAQHGRGLVGVTPPNNLPDSLVRAFCEPGLVPARAFRDYRRWQRDIDDRGVIWLRFGAPDQRIVASPTCAETIIGDPIGPPGVNAVGGTVQPTGGIATNAREVWMYHIDGKLLLLDFEPEAFSGSVAPTRLVSGVLGSYLCGVDTWRCGLTERSIGASEGGPPLHPEDIEHVRQDDQAFISEATTHDDNSIRGERDIHVQARLHRLWDPLSGAPLALVTYAVPSKDLAIETQDMLRTTSLDIAIRQWDPGQNAWRDTTVTRRFTVPDTNVRRPTLTGFVVLPSSPGVSSWSVVVSQPAQRRGRDYDVSTPGLGHGDIELSDLVLGSAAQRLTWELHNVPISLAPTGAVDRTQPVSLYYQIRSANASTTLQTVVAMYRVKDGVEQQSAALQIEYDQPVRAGINEVAPTVDVSRLPVGAYRLEVQLRDANDHVLARRSVSLELR
jgi:hypothetical protein